MRDVRFHEYGGPEVLRVDEVPVPEPGPGQVLLRTEAVGANFVDTKFRAGTGGIFQRPVPAGMTGDVVGTVERTGPDVTGVAPGDRVAALADDGAFADLVLADAEWLAPVPEGLSLADASMLPMGAPVALRVLRTGRLAPGETVLVHAAAGGIGHLAVQIARLLGAGTVIATAGSPEKLDFARAQGADVAIDYRDEDWPEQVRKVAPGGVDVIADSIGGATTRAGLDLLAPYGRLVIYGLAGGDARDIPLQDLYLLRTVTGFSLLAWRAADPAAAGAEIDEVTGWFSTGRLRTALHATLPLAEAAEAHRIIEARAHLGRILLVP